MFRLSGKMVVILACICFVGSITMQGWWIRSAYEGEVSLYNKEKKQFQSEVENRIKLNAGLKNQLAIILRDHSINGSLGTKETGPVMKETGRIIRQILKDGNYRISLSNFAIVNHKAGHKKGDNHIPVAIAEPVINGLDVQKAGRLCLYCLIGNSTTPHDDFNYELTLFYGKQQASIYKKMFLVIIASLLFLCFLALLFKHLLNKYVQEKRLSDAKNGFINNLSHEIQTPVFAIQLANKLIKQHAPHSILQPFINIIDKETKQLKHHAGKILELASLENEQVDLNLQNIELNSFIEEKRPTLEIMLINSGGRLITKYGKRELVAPIDPVHFNNVLVSLTENGIKYNNRAPLITIETGESEDTIFIDLTDNGVGIAKEHLPFVFNKFYRAPQHKINGVKGFGLGLSYVKQIVELHHGQIKISSQVDSGTKISILLQKKRANV